MMDEIKKECSLCKMYYNGCIGNIQNTCEKFIPVYAENNSKENNSKENNIKENSIENDFKNRFFNTLNDLFSQDKENLYRILNNMNINPALFSETNELKNKIEDCLNKIKDINEEKLKIDISNINNLNKPETHCCDNCIKNDVCRYKSQLDKVLQEISKNNKDSTFLEYSVKCKRYQSK